LRCLLVDQIDHRGHRSASVFVHVPGEHIPREIGTDIGVITDTERLGHVMVVGDAVGPSIRRRDYLGTETILLSVLHGDVRRDTKIPVNSKPLVPRPRGARTSETQVDRVAIRVQDRPGSVIGIYYIYEDSIPESVVVAHTVVTIVQVTGEGLRTSVPLLGMQKEVSNPCTPTVGATVAHPGDFGIGRLVHCGFLSCVWSSRTPANGPLTVVGSENIVHVHRITVNLRTGITRGINHSLVQDSLGCVQSVAAPRPCLPCPALTISPT